MRCHKPHRWGHSIFFRLLLIFSVSAILLLAMVIGSAHMLGKPENMQDHLFINNIRQYIDYLVQDWGQPPDPTRMHQSAERLGFHVTIRQGEHEWSSHATITPPPASELHTFKEVPGLMLGTIDKTFYLTFPRADYQYVFAIAHNPLGGNQGWFFVLLGCSILLVLVFAYGGVRRLLKPVRDLMDGAEQLGQGKLDHQITPPRRGELRYVVESFNEMAQRIQSMLKDKEQLLWDVSHELRSPIARMKLALEFIEDGKARTQMANDLRVMEQMVTELLESARLDNSHQTLRMTRFDLGELVRETVVAFGERPPGIRLPTSSTAVYVEADRERIAIVLRNVLENALKYSNQQEQPVEITLQGGEAITITIRDFGSGIPVGERERIFEPFYRVDKSRQTATGGYGLGLSLCRKIIQAHGGDISATENSPHGTTIIITLPLQPRT